MGLAEKVSKLIVGVGTAIIVHTGTVYGMNEIFTDDSGVYATEKAVNNAANNGSPCSTFVSTYAERTKGPAAVLGPLAGLCAGLYVAGKVGRKK